MTIAMLHKFFGLGDEAAELERDQDLIIADEAETAAAMTSGANALRLLEQARTLRARHRPRLYLSLHSSEPVVVSAPSRLSLEIDQHADQTYFELSYPGYTRVELKLPMPEPWGWTFPSWIRPANPAEPGVPTIIAHYFAVGREWSGPGGIVIYGKISPAIAISYGVTAQLRVDVDG